MPILKFTQADLLSSEVVESNYYTAEVTTIDGPKASGSGKSINIFVDFTITDGKFTGKTVKVAFSSGSTNPSLLGVMQWFPYAYLPTLWAAAYNLTRDKIPLEFDSDQLLHKKVDLRIEKTIADGIPINVATGFFPVGIAKTATPF